MEEPMHGSFAEMGDRAGRTQLDFDDRNRTGAIDGFRRVINGTIKYNFYRASSRRLRRRMMRSLGRRTARLLTKFAAWNRAPIRPQPFTINYAG